MNKIVLAIARREAGLYLRSVSLWLAAAAAFAAVFGLRPVAVGPLEHFLGGEVLGVLLTAFIATLVMSAGFSREARESFDDVWNSLPVRNGEQFIGKALGAGVVFGVVSIALLLVIPVGWLRVGTVWAPATTSAVVAYVAQVIGVLVLSIGMATFLRSVIGHVRVRYFVALAIVVALSVASALGIDNDAPWALLLSPFILGNIPYSHSSLFGMFPWFPAVAWHIAFQLLFSIALIALGAVLYERRRDPAQRRTGWALLLAVSVIGVPVAGIQYQSYWNDVDEVFHAHLETDTVYRLVQLDSGESVPADELMPITVTEYTLAVDWWRGSDMHVTAVLAVEGDPAVQPWPLTLHHQWEVSDVTGPGIAGWSRERNVLWVETEAGTTATHVTVQYAARPFLWHKPIGTVSPMHFVSDHGGYLSPLLAWYPLPGERTLATRVRRGEGKYYWTQLPYNGPPPLLASPVPVNLSWSGPADLPIISNLPGDEDIIHDDRRTVMFSGVSDGVSLLIGPLTTAENGDMTIVGASSVAVATAALWDAYDKLLSFYDELVGRTMPREPVVAVPSWLRAFYVTQRVVAISGLDGTSTIPRIETFPLLGTKPVVTEQHLDQAQRQAERWATTGDPSALLAAMRWIQYGVLQSVWGRPHDHLTFAKDPVALALAEYSMLRWAEHVLGPDASARLRDSVQFPNPSRRRIQDEDVADAVLRGLIELEESAGLEAVTYALGTIYDHLATHMLDFAEFESIVAAAKAGVLR